MPMAEKKMTVEVFRYDPDAESGDTRFDSYQVPYVRHGYLSRRRM